jgi:hypothetical protein
MAVILIDGTDRVAVSVTTVSTVFLRHSGRLVAALTIAAALPRSATIDVQGYWLDEALTVLVQR